MDFHSGFLLYIDTFLCALLPNIKIFKNYDIHTEIIAASIRHPLHVLNIAKAGADISTIPYKVYEQMVKHPLTDSGIEKFLKDWESVK